MSLDVLQDMILAAHAAGDGELASWLGEAADDPQLLAKLTGKADATESAACLESEEERADVGRWLLEHGFSGTVTDAAGRKQTYVDGVHVSGAKPGADARTADPHAADSTAAAAQHDAAPKGEQGKFAKAKAAITAKLQGTRGGRAILAMGKGGLWLFHKLERPLLIALHKSNELAVTAAKERGLSDEATAKLKRALMAADFFAGYATGGAALAATGSVWAAKVAAVMPSVSVAYLAYSTVRNPLATWKAARQVVAATFSRGMHESEEGSTFSLSPELAGHIADRIDRSDVDTDWWLACFHVALAYTEGDAERAVELADEAVEAQPHGPTEDDPD